MLTALIGAGALLAGVGISSAVSYYTNSKNQQFQHDANLYNAQTQIELANTAHQREVQDLEASGLNPILSATGGNGASVPTLNAKAPQWSTFDGGIGTSAGSLAKYLSGQMSAQVEQAKASAESDRAYADRAQELVAAEVSSAEAQNSVAHSQARLLELESYADRIEQLARIEALQGHRPGEVDTLVGKWSGGKKIGMEAYENLVQQFRNEIETGRYKSSVERAVGSDLLSGASSAGQIYRSVRGNGVKMKGVKP